MAIGTGNLPYQTSTVSPFDIILAQTTNEMIANINALATGTGLGDNSVTASKLADGAVTNAKLDTTAGDIGGAWKAYTPTVASTVGTITTYTSSGYYTQIGKTIIGSGKFAITNNGTGSGAINVSVPVNNARSNGAGVIHGKEINITGKAIVGQFTGPNSTYLVFGSDNSYPGGTGANVIEFSFTYEAA